MPGSHIADLRLSICSAVPGVAFDRHDWNTVRITTSPAPCAVCISRAHRRSSKAEQQGNDGVTVAASHAQVSARQSGGLADGNMDELALGTECSTRSRKRAAPA